MIAFNSAPMDSLQNKLLVTERVRLLYGGLPAAILLSSLIACLMVVVMWSEVGHSLSIAWLSLMAAAAVGRTVIYLLNRYVPNRYSSHAWLLRFRYFIISTGMVWGLASLLMFPPGNVTHQVFLAFVLAGISSAASSSLASDHMSAVGFIVPALLPLMLNFFIEGGLMQVSMGLMTGMFLVFLVIAASRMQLSLKENIRLRAKSIEHEAATLESEQRFRQMLDSCPTAARIARSGGHEVIFFNASYVKLINASPNQTQGVDPASYYANPQDYAGILQQLKNGEQVFERLVELKMPHDPSAAHKWALASFSHIEYLNEPAILGWFHDITELIRIERLKSEFVSTVSHELRTPLTVISGALGLIAGGALGEFPEQAKQMVAVAHKNSQRLTFLINDLLDMEKLVAGKLEFDLRPHNLLALVEQSIEGNRVYGAEREVKLTLSSKISDAMVRVDSQRVLQVLANLLSNAIKFSPDKGGVEISMQRFNKMLRVTVSDQGIGIPTSFAARIFQKFAQADSSDTRKKGGTGLGLAISKELMERMGGQINFNSVEGQGSSFFFELAEFYSDPQSLNTTTMVGTINTARILVVEDEPEVANFIASLLTQHGYLVDIVDTGREALRVLNQQTYDAMTLDLMLPDMNGLEIINRIRGQAETAKLPIVVLSAAMEQGRLALNGDFSGIEWLAKPIDESRLVSALESYLAVDNVQVQRVLHVEDDIDLHRVICIMAGDRFSFTLATTLAEARHQLEHQKFDLVILDLALRHDSGWSLLPEIRARQPAARVVILSGSSISMDEARMVEAVLIKSRVTPSELLDAIGHKINKFKTKGGHQ